jgi:hypothetical protein
VGALAQLNLEPTAKCANKPHENNNLPKQFAHFFFLLRAAMTRAMTFSLLRW